MLLLMEPEVVYRKSIKWYLPKAMTIGKWQGDRYAFVIENDLRGVINSITGVNAFVSEKEGKVSRLRGKLSSMTNEQIDAQVKTLRDEWQKDI